MSENHNSAGRPNQPAQQAPDAIDLTANLPVRIAPLVRIIKNELLVLRLHWKWYKQLYGTNPERVELLNEVAPDFFAGIQQVLFDDIQMKICRLLDSPGRGTRANITLESVATQTEPKK